MQHQCTVCANGAVRDFKPKLAIYNVGEVYGALESVYAPILQMLAMGAQFPLDVLQSQVSVPKSIQSRVDSINRNPRPCILLKEASSTDIEHEVCLMTTYTGAEIASLPEAFRHFSFPVHPNTTIHSPFDDHIHAIPEWGIETQWIITINYLTRRMRKGNAGRWRCGREPYVFGASAMEHLGARVRTTRSIWQSKCAQDPTFAWNQHREVIEHEANRNRKRSQRNSRSSLGSGRSGLSGSRPYPDPLGRPSMNVPTTIPEDMVIASNGLQGDDENHSALPGPSRLANTPGGVHRMKSPASVHSPRGSRASLVLMDSAFANVRVNTPEQADTKSIRSAVRRNHRKGSLGGVFFKQIKDRVLPSRRSSKE